LWFLFVISLWHTLILCESPINVQASMHLPDDTSRLIMTLLRPVDNCNHRSMSAACHIHMFAALFFALKFVNILVQISMSLLAHGLMSLFSPNFPLMILPWLRKVVESLITSVLFCSTSSVWLHFSRALSRFLSLFEFWFNVRFFPPCVNPTLVNRSCHRFHCVQQRCSGRIFVWRALLANLWNLGTHSLCGRWSPFCIAVSDISDDINSIVRIRRFHVHLW